MSPATLDTTFHALAHPARRVMLAMLADGDRTVGELAAPFDVSLAASAKHVQVLEDAHLLEKRVQGRTHVCSLKADPLGETVDWTERFREHFDPQFRRLDGVLEEIARTRGADRARRRGSR